MKRFSIFALLLSASAFIMPTSQAHAYGYCVGDTDAATACAGVLDPDCTTGAVVYIPVAEFGGGVYPPPPIMKSCFQVDYQKGIQGEQDGCAVGPLGFVETCYWVEEGASNQGAGVEIVGAGVDSPPNALGTSDFVFVGTDGSLYIWAYELAHVAGHCLDTLSGYSPQSGPVILSASCFG
ncbi:MAG: hypothetical protein ACYDCC_08965 [Actinomycetota bacterium]